MNLGKGGKKGGGLRLKFVCFYCQKKGSLRDKSKSIQPNISILSQGKICFSS